jgi:Bacterial regulatory proteins, luxR family
VLGLLAGCYTNAQIGAELFISPRTAGMHATNISRKLAQTRSLRPGAGRLAGRARRPAARPAALDLNTRAPESKYPAALMQHDHPIRATLPWPHPQNTAAYGPT